MFDKLDSVAARYEEISRRLMEPDVTGDPEQYASLMKEYSRLTPIVEKYRAYRTAKDACDEAREVLDESGVDREMRELAQEQLDENRAVLDQTAQELKILLLPRDPNDDKNVIVEIRGGAGGEEAALFAGVLYRMYTMYAEGLGWQCEVISANETELGGYKEICFSITGEGAYSRLKYESGVHRVQRVPETETQGRINKTSSAIRVTHLPTGMVVECQDERSQYKNKDRALKVLRARLLDIKVREQNDKIATERRLQVGTGDRSERIRTYNYPQGRVTDHRIGLTLYKLDSVLNGDLAELFDALMTFDQAEKLKSAEEA